MNGIVFKMMILFSQYQPKEALIKENNYLLHLERDHQGIYQFIMDSAHCVRETIHFHFDF